MSAGATVANAARKHSLHALVIAMSLMAAFLIGAGSVVCQPVAVPPLTVAPNGEVEQRNQDGVLISRISTFKGVQHGHFTQWQAHPWQVVCQGRFRFGVMDGTWEWFDGDGNSVRRVTYQEGAEWPLTLKR